MKILYNQLHLDSGLHGARDATAAMLLLPRRWRLWTSSRDSSNQTAATEPKWIGTKQREPEDDEGGAVDNQSRKEMGLEVTEECPGDLETGGRRTHGDWCEGSRL